MMDPFTSMLCPLAVLTFTLLSEILCSNPSAEAVSFLMQLTCAPVSNNEANTKFIYFYFKGHTFCITLLYEHYFLLNLCLHFGSFQDHIPFASQANEFP